MERKPYQEIKIDETFTSYNVLATYHSDRKCQNYDAQIEAVEWSDGTISLSPNGRGHAFEFCHSDPDRIIALAEMMKAFAQMVKKNNQKTIDTGFTA